MFTAMVEDVEVLHDGDVVAVYLEALPNEARVDEDAESGFLG